jgi:hypothetical protein
VLPDALGLVTEPLLMNVMALAGPASAVVSIVRPFPLTVTPAFTVAVTAPPVVNTCRSSLELGLPASVLVISVVVVLAAQMTEFGDEVTLQAAPASPIPRERIAVEASKAKPCELQPGLLTPASPQATFPHARRSRAE